MLRTCPKSGHCRALPVHGDVLLVAGVEGRAVRREPRGELCGDARGGGQELQNPLCRQSAQGERGLRYSMRT